MKYALITIVALAGLAGTGAMVGYRCCVGSCTCEVNGSTEADSLAWLKQEFSIPPAKMQEIEQMHAAYEKVCEEHCRIIREARADAARLAAAGASEDDIAAAEHRAHKEDMACRAGLDAHVHAVAALIGGAEGQRYLETVLPRLAHFDHQGAPDLALHPGDHHASDPAP